MSAVIDATVLIAALLDSGPNGQWAEAIVSEGALHAPEVLPMEATALLSALERSHEITASEANAAYEDLMQLDLQLYSFEPLAERIWELRHTAGTCDAWHIALAEALGLPLATLNVPISKTQGLSCHFRLPARA